MGEQLPKQIQRIWRLTATIWLVVLLALIGGLFALQHFFHWPAWMGITVLVMAIVVGGGLFAIVPYRYRFWRYQISPLALELQSGFFVRKFEAIPISRIQNVTLEAGPLLQWQHLQAVTVDTASTSHTIAGVTPEVAEQLQQRLLALAQEARDE
ncbi:hypothetical protein IV56_GL000599 [Lacticaseibacillus saniviri JCM 17471 = DSM 24301]|uniref:YdbS-like PH domain-containing protein n=2 Tax=Lacticaseibacillus saniviri TaxID=931533 RepID=A0A0R2MXH8_9LACO|nr:PH domain-containing protein [Lacticaseibacillus saniviri]KRO16912.1 hypothetical protein IV56_GL000599 [Lacticaseibacillus saniviri JCM 17471 = DSM 24301]MCG4282555.1 PH domain-containing protein [Lacticaseibacillus saniviri]